MMKQSDRRYENRSSSIECQITKGDEIIRVRSKACPDVVNLPGRDVDALGKAFDVFSHSAVKLRAACVDSETRLGSLNLELDQISEEASTAAKYIENILQSISDAVIVIDLQMNVIHVNHAASELFHGSNSEIIGRPLKEIFSISSDDYECPLGKAGEVFLPGKSGRNGVHIAYSFSPLMDPREEVIGSILVLSDVTSLKYLEEQLQRTRRLSAMGEMAAGLAHEIRNPLGSLELFSSLLRRELEDGTNKAHLVDNILISIKALTSVTSNLLYFARPCRPAPRPGAIGDVIDAALALCQHMMNKSSVAINRKFYARDHMVLVDGDLMKQAFFNMFLNALQAMEKEGRLYIVISSRDGCVEIEITDNGTGIEPRYLDRVFDPFFSTRERGTGLGLAIVHNIITAHHGSITVSSTMGKGTTFRVMLPSWDLV